MPVDVLSGFPSCITAGTTVRVTRGWSNYLPSVWIASISMRNSQSNLTIVSATNSGAVFDFVFSSTETAALKPGVYQDAVLMTERAVVAEKVVVETGRIRVRPNMADTTPGPRRLAYEAARTALEALASKKFQSVSVEGQSWQLRDINQLADLVRLLEQAALEEDALLGLVPAGGLRRIQMVTR